jgi:glycosyltransferase involved in cell wall biosynthesis
MLREMLRSEPEEVAARVELAGYVPPSQVAQFYGASFVSVSPGSVGLSLTQSLSFGIPMIIARQEMHGPEIEAARDGFNALFVDSDDPSQIADALVTMALDRERWAGRRNEIARDCANRYSAETMAAGFSRAVGSYS